MTPEEQDKLNEDRIKAKLERIYQWDLRYRGTYDPIDFAAFRDDALVCLVEVKARPFARETYPTALIRLRKWAALREESLARDVGGVFVCEYIDALAAIDASDIDPANLSTAVVRQRYASNGYAREVNLLIPIEQMTILE